MTDRETQLIYLQTLLNNGYKFKFRTHLFGKDYVWMEDVNGTVFLERIPANERLSAED